eukprot:31406-Pelagococcus_subviridis.AAC.3
MGTSVRWNAPDPRSDAAAAAARRSRSNPRSLRSPPTASTLRGVHRRRRRPARGARETPTGGGRTWRATEATSARWRKKPSEPLPLRGGGGSDGRGRRNDGLKCSTAAAAATTRSGAAPGAAADGSDGIASDDCAAADGRRRSPPPTPTTPTRCSPSATTCTTTWSSSPPDPPSDGSTARVAVAVVVAAVADFVRVSNARSSVSLARARSSCARATSSSNQCGIRHRNAPPPGVSSFTPPRVATVPWRNFENLYTSVDAGAARSASSIHSHFSPSCSFTSSTACGNSTAAAALGLEMLGFRVVVRVGLLLRASVNASSVSSDTRIAFELAV